MGRRLRNRLMFYTLIINFDGGTYVTQASANSLKNAPFNCIQQWDISDIGSIITDDDKTVLLQQLETEYLSPLTNTNNVWYGHLDLKDKPFTFNLILTEYVSEEK